LPSLSLSDLTASAQINLHRTGGLSTYREGSPALPLCSALFSASCCNPRSKMTRPRRRQQRRVQERMRAKSCEALRVHAMLSNATLLGSQRGRGRGGGLPQAGTPLSAAGSRFTGTYPSASYCCFAAGTVARTSRPSN
jgi:hypothetical protein